MWRPATTIWSSREWSSSTTNTPAAALCAILCAAMLVRFPADDLRMQMDFLLRLAACAGFSLYLWTINPWWGAFMALAGVSHFYPAYTRNSFMAFSSVFYGAVLFAVLCRFVRRESVTFLYNTIAAACCVNTLWMVLQFFELDPIFISVKGREVPEVGLMLNQNFASAFTALCMPVFFRPRWRWGLGIVAIGLILSKSALGAFSAAAGLIFYGAVTGRIYASLALAFIGSLGYILLVDPPGFERWPVWKVGFRGWLKEPWFGYGLGHWSLIFIKPIPGSNSGIWTQAHNEFLQGLFEMGIGFAVIVTGYLATVARQIRLKRMALPVTAIVIIAVNAAANFPFHVGATAIVALVWMAIFEIERSRNL